MDAINDDKIYNLYRSVSFGDGTYYGNKAGGLCQLNVPSLPSVAYAVDALVALNKPQMFGSSACGICLRVNGTGQGLGLDPIQGSFTVYVKDLCPECKAGDVDFAKKADGRWDISIQAIQCPVSGHIEYTLQGSNDYYIKLQVRNDRVPTTTLFMYQHKKKIYVPLMRTRDGFWEFPKKDKRIEKPIRKPIKLRLHAPDRRYTLYDEITPSSMDFKGIIRGKGVQYPVNPNLPSA
ncbi:uncharacterized protein LOC132715407 [Ruditapes philippinarum]|uniref:uncharacterized protein LOC132715407 n=1 Tax=Ruditapes philippinarum TaxID=129788 RepID=UPI00295B7F99|nr:uncharacterized protein LOC132715407 [Ruditapes philippinarum]